MHYNLVITCFHTVQTIWQYDTLKLNCWKPVCNKSSPRISWIPKEGKNTEQLAKNSNVIGTRPDCHTRYMTARSCSIDKKNLVYNHQNKLNFQCDSQRYCIFCCLQQQRGRDILWPSGLCAKRRFPFRALAKCTSTEGFIRGNAIHMANTYHFLGGKSDIRFNKEDAQRRLPHRREPYQGRRILGSDGHAGRWRGGRLSGVHLNYIKACINVL